MADTEQVQMEDASPKKANIEEKEKEEEADSPSEDLFQDADDEGEPTVATAAPHAMGIKQETPATNGTDHSSSRPSDPRISIPRKVPSIPPASDPRSPSSLLGTMSEQNQTPTRPGYPGPKVGLPEGISVPNGVDSKLLQGRLLDALKQLPDDLITDALNEYDDALQNKGGSIRNQGAYLYGVIKRYINVQERAASGNAEHVMGKQLTPEVTERLDKLVAEGFCTQDEMNDKVKSKIRMLSEKDAIFAIDELSSVERGSIRNFSSYFMGILNRYMRGDTSTGGPARPRREDHHRRPRYDSGYPPSRHEHRRSRSRSRSPPRHRNRSPPRRRSRSPSPGYHRRDRDYRGDDGNRRDRPPTSSRSYRDRPRYDDRNQPPQQSSHGHYGPISGVPPPPPPRQQQQGMRTNMNAYTPQQVPQQQKQQQQPPQQQMYVAPNQQQQQMYQQQVPQQFVPQPQVGTQLGIPGSSFVPQQQGMMPQQSPQMGQNYMTNMQPQQYQQGMMTNVHQQSLQGGMAPAPATFQQSTPSIPADILGLADKAASAIQALQASRSSAPAMNVSSPPQMMTMQSMSGQAIQGLPPNNFSSYSNPVASSYPPPSRRGRTTATMSELPIMVQYAVQNLQATGHVDGILDEGILGMISELPEPQALGALQRFASIDTAAMRNKTAYLAGVLRRELEKIQKR